MFHFNISIDPLQINDVDKIWDWLSGTVAPFKQYPISSNQALQIDPDPYKAAMLRRRKRDVIENITSQNGQSEQLLTDILLTNKESKQEASVVENDDLMFLGTIRIKLERREPGQYTYSFDDMPV